MRRVERMWRLAAMRSVYQTSTAHRAGATDRAEVLVFAAPEA
jgi:hypothetical protein